MKKQRKQDQFKVYERNGQLVISLNSEILLPENAPVRLTSAQLEELNYEKLYGAYSPKGRKSKVDGRSCWCLMDAIYVHIRENRYVDDDLCRIILNRKKPSSLADAMEHIKRRSVALCELRAIVIACINMIDHLDPMGCIILLIYLLGIGVDEVCALQLSDWVVDRRTGVSALHISKIANMDTDRWGVKIAAVGPFERKSQYRRIVCSSLVEHILRRYIKCRVKSRQYTATFMANDLNDIAIHRCATTNHAGGFQSVLL